MPPFENGSGDDLITPVYVPPTKQTVTSTKTKPKENDKLCDDEDCLHGSGSGEVTDTYSTSVTSKVDVKGLYLIVAYPTETNVEYFTAETDFDSNGFSTTEIRRTDTTIPDVSKPGESTISSSADTTILQETTHVHTFGTSTTDHVSTFGSSSTTGMSSSSSISTASSTITTTKSTTPYVPPQTEATIPYTIKETIPTEGTTIYHDSDNEIYHPHPDDHDYDEPHLPDPPIPEPETEPPAVFRPPPINTAGGNFYNNNPTRPSMKNKHPRINSEAEERTAMIIGIVAGALIAVILVILLVLWIKSNGDRAYKMEHDLKYGHGANAALLGHNAGNSNMQQQQQQGGVAHQGSFHGAHGSNNNGAYQQNNQQYGQNGSYNNNGNQNYDGHGNGGQQHGGVNGSLRQQHSSQNSDRNGMSAGPVQGGAKAKRNSKDIKEWYV